MPAHIHLDKKVLGLGCLFLICLFILWTKYSSRELFTQSVPALPSQETQAPAAKEPQPVSMSQWLRSQDFELKHITQSGEMIQKTVRLPQLRNDVSAELMDMRDALQYEAVFGESHQETKVRFAECMCGITAASYEVSFESESLISFIITIDRMGAYPSQEVKYYTFDLKTGKRVSFADLTSTQMHDQLLKELSSKLQKQLDDVVSFTPPDVRKIWGTQKYSFYENTHARDQFRIYSDRIIWFYPFDLPHVYKALEPQEGITVYLKDQPEFWSAVLQN